MTSRYDDGQRSWWGQDGLDIDDTMSTYIASIYWAATTITTVNGQRLDSMSYDKRSNRIEGTSTADRLRVQQKSTRSFLAVLALQKIKIEHLTEKERGGCLGVGYQVGYGDITPTNDLERAVACLTMVCGTTMFSYVIGSVSTLVM